jgi:diguanylate cyclase (GGDEF)-like protein
VALAEPRQRSATLLARQLRLLVGALVLALYVVGLLATAMGSRRAVEAELSAAAADAAHDLAGSLGPATTRGDRDAVAAALDTVVARSHLRVASVATPGADPWVQRERARQARRCPAWLAHLLPVASSPHALDIDGTGGAARVTVLADAARGQDLVWEAVLHTAVPAAIAAVALLLGVWSAVGAVSRPLRGLEAKARDALRWDAAPDRADAAAGDVVSAALAELGRRSRLLLTGAQALASTLHERASRDQLTGLLTRSWLLDILEYRRRDPEQAWTGALLLARVDGVKGVNDTFGYAAGDDVLRETARLLEDTLGHGPEVLIAHLAGGEFAAFVPSAGPVATRERVATLNAALGRLASRLRFPTSLVTYAGGAYFHGQTISALFAEADRDLRKTEWRNVPGRPSEGPVRPRHEPDDGGRRDATVAALRSGGLRLLLQPAVAYDSRALRHLEAYARIEGNGSEPLMPVGELLAAGDPAVAAEVDRAVVAEALRRLADHPGDQPMAVNLAPSSLRAPGMSEWLASAARASPAQARRLILEIADPGVQAAVPEAAALAERLAPFGVRLAVDHFGTGAASFDYLHRLPLCHLKIDGSFAARLERHVDSRCYVRAAAHIARGLGIPVYVEAIESEAQWQALEGLGVDGAQGYHLGRPG